MTARGKLSILWAALAAVVVVGIIVQLGSARSGAPASADVAPSGTTISEEVSDNSCGGEWSAPAGPVTFAITDAGANSTDVYVEDLANHEYFAEFEGVGSGATLSLTPVLDGGSYRLDCFPNDGDPQLGPAAAVTGSKDLLDATPGVLPVTKNDLLPVVQAYQKWVAGQLPLLHVQLRRLRAAVAAGDIKQAKADWLAAHMRYETLGAAYDAFGDFDSVINGIPESGHPARGDPNLTGFHKLEALLWAGAPTSELVPVATALDNAVRKLEGYFATVQMDPAIIALRAHEIVENAIQFELTGKTDAGSHTNLATISANLAGAEKTLSFVEPLLATRYPALPQTKAALAASQQLLAGYDHDGSWTPLSTLTTSQREHLDASLDGLVELLAPLAAICDIRYEVQ